MTPLRCAVYTRKSTENGLEQEFNSLDAQREACEAYILSQRHEGWSLVPDHYDDGGYSGGNMDRPGLKALLDEVDAGRVDVIVVYKVDRLTRSLADFAKIVERLDAKAASFVSITQAFNTTTSMGRLTLNVLLSFAQFEREVTGERIRDKIAASKRKGIWMGGPVPLGYEVVERKLVVVPEEAERVRYIMRCYLEERAAPQLLGRLARERIVTKIQNRVSGPHRGGIPFARGSLFHLLHNAIYRGKIVHKGQVYDGEHRPIVDEELWNAVQAKLKEKAPPRKRDTNDPQPALLRGLLIDQQGRPIVGTYTSRGTRRYAHYETRKDLARPDHPPSTRFRRGQLDQHVIDHLFILLMDDHALRRISGLTEGDQLRTLFATARQLSARLEQRPYIEDTARSLITRIQVHADELEISINCKALGFDHSATLSWSIPRPARKPFREAKLRIDGSEKGKEPNRPLIDLLAQAREVQQLVMASPELALHQLAKREGRCRKQLTKLLRISYLSPRIVEAILKGTQPKAITRKQLLGIELPIIWTQQEELFGLAA